MLQPFAMTLLSSSDLDLALEQLGRVYAAALAEAMGRGHEIAVGVS